MFMFRLFIPTLCESPFLTRVICDVCVNLVINVWPILTLVWLV